MKKTHYHADCQHLLPAANAVGINFDSNQVNDFDTLHAPDKEYKCKESATTTMNDIYIADGYTVIVKCRWSRRRRNI
jgi:hypothetical protein